MNPRLLCDQTVWHKYCLFSPIGFYGKYSASRMLWIAYEVSYPGKLMSVLCKDVGSYSTCQRYRFPVGTLLWKVSQIL